MLQIYLLDASTQKKLFGLCKKITEEHFEMTLAHDRNINYLWHMYHKAVHKGEYKPFIFKLELSLNQALGIVTKEETDSLFTMLDSQDSDNVFIALLAIENFRKKRIKTHGQYKKGTVDVSPELFEIVSKYSTAIINKYSFN